MDRIRKLDIITAGVFFITLVVGISIIWAAYTSNLTIRGTATAAGARWSVVFKDLEPAVTGNTQAGITSTAREISAPRIVGNTSIEDFDITVKTPGDFVSYKFKISNEGTFDAMIDESFNKIFSAIACGRDVDIDMQSDSLILGPGAASNPGVIYVTCEFGYSLTYADGTMVESGDIFEAGEEKEVILKMQYKDDIDADHLPNSSVMLPDVDVTIPFVQK